MQMRAFARENSMWLQRCLHIQIARRCAVRTGFTFTGQTNAIAFIHTRRAGALLIGGLLLNAIVPVTLPWV